MITPRQCNAKVMLSSVFVSPCYKSSMSHTNHKRSYKHSNGRVVQWMVHINGKHSESKVCEASQAHCISYCSLEVETAIRSIRTSEANSSHATIRDVSSFIDTTIHTKSTVCKTSHTLKDYSTMNNDKGSGAETAANARNAMVYTLCIQCAHDVYIMCRQCVDSVETM